VTDSFLTSIAEAAGLKDIDKWNSDRQDSRWDAVLSKNSTEAQNLGFTGTPSILVQGPGGRKPFAAIPTFSQIQTAVKAVR
jgi:protein-disulfide isomerase